MPYSLIADQLGRDPRWGAMADGKRALRDALGWSYVRMMCETASHVDDGYLTHEQALSCCDGRRQVLELLTTPMLGRPPMLHRPGQQCAAKNCLDSSPPWVAGYAYRLCGYLKRNPSKAEKDRSDAQKADSRDAVLRRAVYERDGGCCRYCRSGPLALKGMGRAKDRRRALQFDHPDPDRAAEGGDNYLTACARCNEEKGHRTPAEAGMRRLPAPTPVQAAWWAERGEQLFDRPEDGQESPADNAPDNPPDNHHDNAPDNQQGVVDSVVHTVVRNTPSGVHAHVETPGQGQDNGQDNPPEGSGSGRVGQHAVGGSLGPGGQPVRDASSPDIYHRRSRAPVGHDQPRGSP
ncbi:HNH endonuclease [Actinophytocola sediminis]